MEPHHRTVEANNPATFYKDYAELKKFGGKYFTARDDAIAVRDAKLIPNITGDLLVGGRSDLHSLIKAPSLVLFKFKQSGEDTLKDYRDRYLKEMKAESVIDVIVTENSLQKLWSPIIKRTLRNSTPKQLHAHTLLHYGQIPQIRLELGMKNSLVGWAFIVDASKRIRWEAHAKPTEEELASMCKILHALEQ